MNKIYIILLVVFIAILCFATYMQNLPNETQEPPIIRLPNSSIENIETPNNLNNIEASSISGTLESISRILNNDGDFDVFVCEDGQYACTKYRIGGMTSVYPSRVIFIEPHKYIRSLIGLKVSVKYKTFGGINRVIELKELTMYKIKDGKVFRGKDIVSQQVLVSQLNNLETMIDKHSVAELATEVRLISDWLENNKADILGNKDIQNDLHKVANILSAIKKEVKI